MAQENSTDIEMQPKLSRNATDSSGTNSKTDSATDDKPPILPPRRNNADEKGEERNNAEYARVNKRQILGASFPPRIEFIYKPENTKSYMSCLQKCVVVINLFIWLLGAVITAIGIWVEADEEFWAMQSTLDLTQFAAAGWVLIAVGVVIMLIGCIGCWGAIASKIWMLVIFAIIVIILIIMEIAVIALVWSAMANESMKEEVKRKAQKGMHEMPDYQGKIYFRDLVQSKLHCCGVDGPGEYADRNKEVPNSCKDHQGQTYTKGCYDAVLEFLKSKAAVMGGVAIAVLLLQLGVLVLVCCLVCGIKNSATNVIF